MFKAQSGRADEAEQMMEQVRGRSGGERLEVRGRLLEGDRKVTRRRGQCQDDSPSGRADEAEQIMAPGAGEGKMSGSWREGDGKVGRGDARPVLQGAVRQVQPQPHVPATPHPYTTP